MKKSVFGLDENIAGLLCYVLGFISGIVVLVMEKENQFVRFHALQSIIWFVLLAIAGRILGWLPLIGGLLGGLVSIIVIASWLFLMYNAYMGKKFKIPMIGDAVEKQLSK